MTIGPAPRIMIFLRSVLFETLDRVGVFQAVKGGFPLLSGAVVCSDLTAGSATHCTP